MSREEEWEPSLTRSWSLYFKDTVSLLMSRVVEFGFLLPRWGRTSSNCCTTLGGGMVSMVLEPVVVGSITVGNFVDPVDWIF
mmetsp:Transcript_23261/g.36538  ORF Transcript_23261/g.36538 Transcript_23261/m.36538 type:complete len:82 (+) Transcript_23261:1278-1523(+)